MGSAVSVMAQVSAVMAASPIAVRAATDTV